MSKYRLPARPIPILGESPASVLLRAVDGNGYNSLLMLIRAYWKKEDIAWATAAFADPSRYTEIMEAFGICRPEEEMPCFLRNGPTSESARLIDGMAVPEKLFREDVRYYCPECLGERKFWRKLWSLKPYSVCPQHGSYLLRDCPACGKVLGLSRGKLVVCECGADLTEAHSDVADSSALEWWLECHRGEENRARLVDEILLAIGLIDGKDDSPQSEHRRLCAARDWAEFEKVAPWLVELVGKGGNSLHPRIQLLPLLRGNYPQTRELAKKILCLWPVIPPSELESGDDSMSRCNAELALGISTAQFRHFEKHKLLEFPDGRKRVRGKVSYAAVNRLLFALQAKEKRTDIEARGQTVSLASIAADVLSGSRKSAGYDIADGLRSFHLQKCQGDCLPASNADEDWIGVNRISEILATYPEAVRFLCKKEWIASKRFSNNRLMARKGDVEEFNRQYILGGTFAAQVGENPTNISEKLMAIGVKPVGGPRVDGTLVYLFMSEDIEKVDVNLLRGLEKYPTNTGRKSKTAKDGVSSSKGDAISVAEAAGILGIKAHEVPKLIRKRVLEKLDRLDRGIFVSRRKVRRLYSKINSNDMIPVEEAARRLNQSGKSMESAWIKTGVLKVHDFGLWRRVGRASLERLENLLQTHMTAKEAGKIYSMHRSYLPNLERQGAINSRRIGKNGAIRLYARADLRRFPKKTYPI